MIRIRCIHSCVWDSARERVAQVADLFRQAFPELAEHAEKLPEILNYPVRFGYRAALLVAESAASVVTGFALVLHFPEIPSSFLDYLAVRKGMRSGGLGGALYEATREYCQRIGSRGLYVEVEPDSPETAADPAELDARRKRLRFYEQHGVRPIVNTAYDMPVGDPPTRALLLFDGLGRTDPLGRDEARLAVRAILTRRFGHVASPDYVEHVVRSFVDDPVRFRAPCYSRKAELPHKVGPSRLLRRFVLASDRRHVIHHVRERGYLERPARVSVLVEAAEQTGLFTALAPRPAGESPILTVHDHHFVEYLQKICGKLREGRPVYPDTFPTRRPERRPKVLPVQAGYYCIDSSTPLDRNAYRAARAAVDVAMTCATEILTGAELSYAACRPPGHHAERQVYGGFCYFNNAAVAAHYLSRYGRVCVLDVDFHHGNGTQDIFYRRSDVLTLSIHGHPDHAYPYFSGFADETGEGPGIGFNRNFPLPPETGHDRYLAALDRALKCLTAFGPDFLVLSLGFDTLRADPIGTCQLTVETMSAMGQRLGALKLPVLVVQEGGYNLRNLRRGAAALFEGIAGAMG